jgi:hypothetical protein
MKKFLLPLAVMCSCAHAGDKIYADGFDVGGSACVEDPERTRMLSIGVGYSVSNIGNLLADTTQFQTIFGRGSVLDTITYPFTGVSGSGPVFHWIFSHQYYSGLFHTPASGRYTGSLSFQSNDSRGCRNRNGSPGPCGQPFYDVSISSQCNDYSDTATFVALHAYSDGMPSLSWSLGFTETDLRPDTDYYLNIRMTDPNDSWPMAYMIWYGWVH